MPENISYENLGALLGQIPWLDPLLQVEFLGNSVAHYLTVVFAVALTYAVAKLISLILERYARRLTAKTANQLDDMVVSIVHRSVTFILVLGAVYFGVRTLNVPDAVDNFMVKAVFILFVLKVTKEFETFVEFLIESYIRPLAQRQKGLVKTFVPPMLKFTKFVVWTLAILLIISNLGYNITSIIAGLGIGGLAVALAAQETISHAFGSLTILTDQPFKVGDWVETDGVEGEVLEIGIRSTKIQTLERTVVSVPNGSLASSKINNYSKRNARKVEQTFDFAYDTTVVKMKTLLKTIESIIKKDKDTEVDTMRVHFKDFGESALKVEVLYYITDMTSYSQYLNIRQRINLKIKAAAEKLRADMAFPTRSLYIENAKDFNKVKARR
jgi:MscS family membrane protein